MRTCIDPNIHYLPMSAPSSDLLYQLKHQSYHLPNVSISLSIILSHPEKSIPHDQWTLAQLINFRTDNLAKKTWLSPPPDPTIVPSSSYPIIPALPYHFSTPHLLLSGKHSCPHLWPHWIQILPCLSTPSPPWPLSHSNWLVCPWIQHIIHPPTPSPLHSQNNPFPVGNSRSYKTEMPIQYWHPMSPLPFLPQIQHTCSPLPTPTHHQLHHQIPQRPKIISHKNLHSPLYNLWSH